jgi:hypothetical protein
MKIRTIALAAALTLASGAAFAHSCPKEMRAIDEALPKAQLTEGQMTEVKKLRADGETLHKSGKHTESMEALGKAKKMLSI